jgi:hypothetical protein
MKGGNFGDGSPSPNNFLNQEIKVAPAAAVDIAVTRGFNYCQETKLSRRGGPEK